MVSGTHGYPLLGEQVGDIGVVHAVDDEAGQRRLRCPQYSHALTVSQAAQQMLVQAGFVGFDSLGVEAGQIIQGRPQAYHPGDWRRTRLEPQRRRAEAGALVLGQLHHLATELPMAQQLQRPSVAVQHANPIRAVQLVAGEHIEVAAQLLHIVAAMHHALGTVDHGQRALCAGMGKQGRQRLPGTQYVGQLADGEHPGARAYQLQCLVQVDAAKGIQRQYHQAQVAPACQLLPGQQVGMVLQRADGNFVTGFEAVLKAVGQQIQGRGGTVSEHDLP
ncbi:hypothetical protein D3C81_1331740 [compost metagenome]